MGTDLPIDFHRSDIFQGENYYRCFSVDRVPVRRRDRRQPGRCPRGGGVHLGLFRCSYPLLELFQFLDYPGSLFCFYPGPSQCPPAFREGRIVFDENPVRAGVCLVSMAPEYLVGVLAGDFGFSRPVDGHGHHRISIFQTLIRKFRMRSYWLTLTLVFSGGLALAWVLGLDHRLSYLSKDYALLIGKERLVDDYSRPGLAIFVDSVVMDGIQPERLDPAVINCAMNGSTPIESYFLIKRLMKAPAHPQAILLSYSAYHFIHPDFYWENTVKFGLLSGAEADEVMNQTFKLKDKELISHPGPY